MENTATPSTNSQARPVEENHSWREINVEQPRTNLPPPYEENIHQPEYATQMFPSINEQPTGQTILLIQPTAGDANYVDPCLTLSIISCLCCFAPTGIVAIVMSCLVRIQILPSIFYSEMLIFLFLGLILP
ncbi:---NA--- [Paramuricea clavata]|uniref:---NA n=1 Tax=Paramuricea clavata TaxID=317549 RepID=A0A7D9DTF4_PARCT|nr:---NA--- [Paramuricea clavata]